MGHCGSLPCERFDSSTLGMKKIDTSNYEQVLLNRSLVPPEFPSLKHKIAWDIAEYLGEPYGFWVRMVGSTTLWAGQIEHELDNLRRKGFPRTKRAKMMMKYLFPNGQPS